MKLEPNYANTVRWFAQALIDHTFQKGGALPVMSFIEQVRYLHQTNPQELEAILNELRARS